MMYTQKIVFTFPFLIFLFACSIVNIERSRAHFLPLLNNLNCANCLATSQSYQQSEEKPQELQTSPVPPSLSQSFPPDVINFQISPSSIFAYLTWTNPSFPNFQWTRILRRSDNFPISPSDPNAVLVYQGIGTEHLDGILTHQTNYFYAAYVYDGEQFSNGVTLNIMTMKSGDLDVSFVPSSVGNVRSIFIQNDKKILVGGAQITRLLSNGSLDNSFTTGAVNDTVYKVIQHASGKIYVFGNFTTYNTLSMNRIVRLYSDGVVDTSLAIGTGPNSGVLDAHVYPDESFIIGGSFVSYNSINANRILKILANGTIDPSFIIGTGFNNSITSLTVQEDGKIFVTGLIFSQYNGTPRARIARLHSNGTLDASLPIESISSGPNNLVQSHLVLENGKYLISGSFTKFGSAVVPRIARINVDGTLDASFTPATGPNGGNIFKFLELPNHKLIIVGNFTSYDNITRNRIARLNENGSIDEEFDPCSGADNSIYDVKLTYDGRILIGGIFTSYNGSSILNIAKIYP